MKKRLTLLYTGDGKGKTTAALGLVFRACGHGLRCAVVQFIKENPQNWGEWKCARRLDVDWFNYGKGFTWKLADTEPSRLAVRAGWQQAVRLIDSGKYALVVLDECTYPLEEGWIEREEMETFLTSLSKHAPHIVLTGRKAPDWLIGCSDLVSEVVEIKHPFREQNVTAQIGIEF